MGKKTKIDWCNSTWNPVTGCLHGCAYCYARRIAERFGGYPSDEKLHEFNVRQMVRHRNDDGEWNRWYKCAYPFSDWIIIGAETGNRKDKVIPKVDWIMEILQNAEKTGTPVFMKKSLRELMGDDFRQEFPWEAQR